MVGSLVDSLFVGCVSVFVSYLFDVCGVDV